MRKYKQFSVSLVLWLFFVGCSASVSHAQSPLRTIDNPQGGKIVYGVVDGATTSAAAMGTVLRIVHNNCGEKPQVGKVFKVRGTNSDAVFFTVVNHPQGNKQVAGLLIAAPIRPQSDGSGPGERRCGAFWLDRKPHAEQAIQRVASGWRGASFRPRDGRQVSPSGTAAPGCGTRTVRPALPSPTAGKSKATGAPQWSSNPITM